MFGSDTLEVAIGIIFVFILVATICTAIREGIEAWSKTRAAYLEQGIRQLLHDTAGTGIVKAFYDHPLINGLFNSTYTPGAATDKPAMLAKGGTLPSYIPSKNFAQALMDIAARGPVTDVSNTTAAAPEITIQLLRQNVAQISNPAVQRILLHAIDTAKGEIDNVESSLMAWYDSGMDRVSGWYKRSSQWIIFWIAIVVAVGLNINTLAIISYLAKNDTARKVLVEKATTVAKDPTYRNAQYKDVTAELNALKIPIGWSEGLKLRIPDRYEKVTKTIDGGKKIVTITLRIRSKTIHLWVGIFSPLLGWLLTALAAMLGAPFWFDVLNRVMVIRSTVKPHEKSGEEASQDHQENKVVVVQPAAAATAASPEAPLVVDDHSEADTCDVIATDLTTDEQLPVSIGG